MSDGWYCDVCDQPIDPDDDDVATNEAATACGPCMRKAESEAWVAYSRAHAGRFGRGLHVSPDTA